MELNMTYLFADDDLTFSCHSCHIYLSTFLLFFLPLLLSSAVAKTIAIPGALQDATRVVANLV